jgi:hypothetical protein
VHCANSNAEATSKIGLLNVYCRPDCVPRDENLWNYPGMMLPIVRSGALLPPFAR